MFQFGASEGAADKPQRTQYGDRHIGMVLLASYDYQELLELRLSTSTVTFSEFMFQQILNRLKALSPHDATLKLDGNIRMNAMSFLA